MNFSIQSITENALSLIRLTNHSSHTTADILPAYGALLHAFTIQTANGPLNVIDNYPNKTAVENQLATSFKSSKLSPFVCRLPGGKYKWRNTNYEFTSKFMDGSAIHGLLYNKSFYVADQYVDDEQASVRLKYHYNKEDSGYPFNYTCEVLYTLKPDNSLTAETTLQNLEDSSIPIADGWHPYFTLGGRINEYALKFASDTMLEFNDKLIPTGKFLHDPSFKESALIGDRFLDNCYQLKQEEGSPVCVLYNPANQLTLHIYANANYPYLQLYTPDHRKSIAIENLSGAPDCFNNGMGLKILPPGNTETFNVRYKLLLR